MTVYTSSNDVDAVKRHGSGNDIVYDRAVLSQVTEYALKIIINQYQVQSFVEETTLYKHSN